MCDATEAEITPFDSVSSRLSATRSACTDPFPAEEGSDDVPGRVFFARAASVGARAAAARNSAKSFAGFGEMRPELPSCVAICSRFRIIFAKCRPHALHKVLAP